MNRPHQRLARDEDDRHQVLLVVAVHLQDLRRAGDVVVGEQDVVAVGRALRDRLDSDRAAGAGPILDDNLLSDRPRHGFARQARQEVGAAAGREHHDHADRTRRIGLRPRWSHDRRRGERGTGKRQELAADEFHSSLPGMHRLYAPARRKPLLHLSGRLSSRKPGTLRHVTAAASQGYCTASRADLSPPANGHGANWSRSRAVIGAAKQGRY
jgi:hypothetical protein